VVGTRPLPTQPSVPRGDTRSIAPPVVGPRAPVVSAPAPQIVPAPKRADTVPVPARPAFGVSPIERPRPTQAPRLETTQRPEAARRSSGGASPGPGSGPRAAAAAARRSAVSIATAAPG